MRLLKTIELHKERKDIGNKIPTVAGIAWLDNKIYVLFQQPARIRVLSDKEPFEKNSDEEFHLTNVEYPVDMVPCKISRSLFISEVSNTINCIHKFSISDNYITRNIPFPSVVTSRTIQPRSLSTSFTPKETFGYLLALVELQRESRHYLYIFKTTDCSEIRHSLFDISIEPKHAVQSSLGKIIVSYIDISNYHRKSYIGELFHDERSGDVKISRRFDLDSMDAIEKRQWYTNHLAIDDNDNIFILDTWFQRVLFLNAKWSKCEIILTHKSNKNDSNQFRLNCLDLPVKLYYNPEQQQLIVTQWRADSETDHGSTDHGSTKRIMYIITDTLFVFSFHRIENVASG